MNLFFELHFLFTQKLDFGRGIERFSSEEPQKLKGAPLPLHASVDCTRPRSLKRHGGYPSKTYDRKSCKSTYVHPMGSPAAPAVELFEQLPLGGCCCGLWNYIIYVQQNGHFLQEVCAPTKRLLHAYSRSQQEVPTCSHSAQVRWPARDGFPTKAARPHLCLTQISDVCMTSFLHPHTTLLAVPTYTPIPGVPYNS